MASRKRREQGGERRNRSGGQKEVSAPMENSTTVPDSTPITAAPTERSASPQAGLLGESPTKSLSAGVAHSPTFTFQDRQIHPLSTSGTEHWTAPDQNQGREKGPENHRLIVRFKVPENLRRSSAVEKTKSPEESDRELYGDENDGLDQRRGKARKAVSSVKHLTANPERPRSKMAPVGSWETDRFKDNDIDVALKETIQSLFDIQAATLGYVPETQAELVNKIENLTLSLQTLRALTTSTNDNAATTTTTTTAAAAADPSSSSSSTDPIVSASLPLIPPEIIQYVDEGRNPDIYTREFVESIIRYNQNIHGKRRAFADFSDLFAHELVTRVPGLERHVATVLDAKSAAAAVRDDARHGPPHAVESGGNGAGGGGGGGPLR